MDDPLSAKFTAIAHPVRRAMLERLTSGSATVGELGEPFNLTSPAISNHIRVLEQAGLIERRVAAQTRIISLRADELLETEGWLKQIRSDWTTNRINTDIQPDSDTKKPVQNVVKLPKEKPATTEAGPVRLDEMPGLGDIQKALDRWERRK